ncbi:MAG: TonB-dependent receptor plug domain-containing protein [Bacteroidetes bacterium]|nr:TonB-dependent receptor plug domain-containing protein [Bacteroidota bacterium]
MKQKIHVLSKDSPQSIRLSVKNYLSEEVTITATRMDGRNGFAYSNQNKEELEKKNLGQDLPFLLNMTPSLVVTSDAGNGVGYTGLRIRGSDESRINVTLNGIPVNDPESHQVYWVDLPDLASSAENIQVQRGVEHPPMAPELYGGGVNIQSSAFQSKAFGQVNSAVGSFNTWKTPSPLEAD